MLDLTAMQKLLELAPGRHTTTTDSSTQFIAGAKLGSKVAGESVAPHRGRTTVVWETRNRNAEGRLRAVVTPTQRVLEAGA